MKRGDVGTALHATHRKEPQLPEGTVGIVVGAANARVGMQAAVERARAGGSAVDAAIAGARKVEDNLEDHGVGTGGTPNILGQVELDASIMDGKTLATGAVGAIKNYPNPIDIARKVMELTPHVFLVGEGAELFAKHQGFKTSNLLTPEAEQSWNARIEQLPRPAATCTKTSTSFTARRCATGPTSAWRSSALPT